MRNHLHNAVLLGALLVASALAHAQYAWIDEKGVRHYSDQPPPTSTPTSKILKSPRAGAVQEPAPAAEPAKAPPTLAEREADYKKRQAAAAESSKKAAADKQLADATRTRCNTAAQNKSQLASGRPMRNEAGVALTDADRTREMATAETILKECK